MNKVVYKNVKINERHHKVLKDHCDKNGLKIHKIIEKWIEENIKNKKRDIYGED
jgi:hypothetical protein